MTLSCLNKCFKIANEYADSGMFMHVHKVLLRTPCEMLIFLVWEILKYLSLRPVFPIVVKFLESGSGIRLSILPVMSSHVQIQPFKFGEWAFSSENFPRTFSPDLMMDMSTGQTPLFNTSMPVCNVEAPAALGTFCFHRLHILLFRIS